MISPMPAPSPAKRSPPTRMSRMSQIVGSRKSCVIRRSGSSATATRSNAGRSSSATPRLFACSQA